MRTFHSSTFAFALALVACRQEDVDTDEPSFWDDIDTQSRFDTWVASLEAQAQAAGVAGFQVAVAIEGELRHTASWGVRDVRTDAPVTDETRFGLASIGKMFAGATALDLQEDGLIDLDAPVTDVSPSFAVAEGYDAEQLTTRMGLGHTSGLPDLWSLGCDYDTYDEVWQAHPPPVFTPPGEVFAYSNLGYTMVGHAIEGASGMVFGDAVDERVFQPLGLTATYDIGEVLAGDYAVGHQDGEIRYEVTEDNWGCVMSKAAGGLWGTTSDVATFLAATARGEGPLQPDSFDQLAGGHADSSCGSGLGSYGLGLATWTDSLSGYTALHHSGGIAGFGSQATYLPELDIAVVAVVNDWSTSASPWAWEGLDILLDEPFTPSEVPPPPDASLFEGTYVHVDANDDVRPPDSGMWRWSTIQLGQSLGELLAWVDSRPVGAIQNPYGNCFEIPDGNGNTLYVEMWPNGEGGFDRLLTRGEGSGLREELLPTE